MEIHTAGKILPSINSFPVLASSCQGIGRALPVGFRTDISIG